MPPAPYLSVAEVATELGRSTSGVYKLIQREKLGAIRLSERRTVVARITLDACRRRLKHGPPTTLPIVIEDVDLATRAERFRAATGSEPEEWVTTWKADLIEDRAEKMRRMIDALGILAVRREQAAVPLAGAPADPASVG